MKSHSLFFTTLASIFLALLVLSGLSINTLYSAAPSQIASIYGHREPEGTSGSEAAPDPGNDPKVQLVVGDKVTALLSQPLRSMPASLPQGANPDRTTHDDPIRTTPAQGGAEVSTGDPDALLASSIGGPSVAQLGSVNFDGLSYESGGSGYPPDPVGEVGPNHYVQSVNSSFQIFNKNGVSVGGPYTNNTLWAGQSGRCATENDGNPIVLYDQEAERWLFAQFVASSPYRVCVAISQNEDPLGSYYLYEFNTDETSGGALADYFKFGIGADGYYMSASETQAGLGYTAYAFDRDKMVLGQNAGFVKFTNETNFLLPADIEGATPPPNGMSGYFYTYKDANFPAHGNGPDRIELFQLRADFATEANSTFTRIATLPITPFTYTVCGFFNYDCIPQPDTEVKVDAISEWPMFRFVYRNFGAYQSLVGNFTVDAGNDRAGIRWFELRPSAGTWQLYQEGTVAPGTEHRWTGSISIDQAGNIALGYNVSSDSVYPSLAFVHRLASDPLGQMRAETILHPGTASQTNTGPGGMRWGEYSDLTIDPVDNCTFWYTSEYYDTSSPNWKTRVATFMVPGCDAPQPTPTPTGTPGEPLLLYIPLVMNHTVEEPTPTPTMTPTVTPTQAPNLPLVNGNFEQGSGVGWTEYSTNAVYPVVRTDIPVGEYQGQYAAWLSGVQGAAEITQIYQQITVPEGARLYYRYYIQSQETVCSNNTDVGYVAISVNGGTATPIRTYQLCQANNTTSYQLGSVSLTPYDGQTVTLIIGANTDATLTSNLFIDSVGYTPAVAESTTPPIIRSQLDGRKTPLTPAPPTTAPLPVAIP